MVARGDGVIPAEEVPIVQKQPSMPAERLEDCDYGNRNVGVNDQQPAPDKSGNFRCGE